MSHLGTTSQPDQTATLRSTAPLAETRAWLSPAATGRYTGWSGSTFWRKNKAGLPVYYATDSTPAVYRQDIDAFLLGASPDEMPSLSLRVKLRRRATA
jgi:hypothetical protein